MIITRLKQMYRYFCVKYDIENDNIAKSILSQDEYAIYASMSNYEKIHSILVYHRVIADNLLGSDINYAKLALLHDCGKGATGFGQRLLEVVLRHSTVSHHAYASYIMILPINPYLAELARLHHSETADDKMARFQEIDSIS